LWGEAASLRALLIALLAPAAFLLLTWLKPPAIALASALVVSACVIAAIALAQYLGFDPFRLLGWQAPPAGSVRMNVYATLGNPNFVAAFLASVLPLAWVPDGAGRTKRLLSGASALIMVLAIIATGSRAPIAGAISLVICFAWLLPSVSLRTRTIGLVSILLFAVLVVHLSTGRPLREVLEGRFFIWRVVVGHVSARTLILGGGPGWFAIKYPEWETGWAAHSSHAQNGLRFLGYQDHAHNDWLEVLLEQGIPGLILLLLIPVAVWRMSTSRWLEITSASAGALAGIAVFAGVACVDFPFHRPAESFALWTMLAIVHLSSLGEGPYDSIPKVTVRSSAADRSCRDHAGSARRVSSEAGGGSRRV